MACPRGCSGLGVVLDLSNAIAVADQDIGAFTG
jgi:hypothetical protein